MSIDIDSILILLRRVLNKALVWFLRKSYEFGLRLTKWSGIADMCDAKKNKSYVRLRLHESVQVHKGVW